MTSNTKLQANGSRGYLIALLEEQPTGRLRALGSPADRLGQCDEILEINGRQVDGCGQHEPLVGHIQECIRLKNISLRVRRPGCKQSTDAKQNSSSLLDVFVIGTNAREQLNRFLAQNRIFAGQDDLLNLTTKMDILEPGTLSRASLARGGAFSTADGKLEEHNRPPAGASNASFVVQKQHQATCCPEPRIASQQSPSGDHTSRARMNSLSSVTKETSPNPDAPIHTPFHLKLAVESSQTGGATGPSPDSEARGECEPLGVRVEGARCPTTDQTHETGHTVDICAILSRLSGDLDGVFAQKSTEANLTKLFSIYETIIGARREQEVSDVQLSGSSPGESRVAELLQSVALHLRAGELTSDRVELVSLLSRHEMDSVCWAFDRVWELLEPLASSSRPDGPPSRRAASQASGGQRRPASAAEQVDGSESAAGARCKRRVCIQKNSSQALGATIRNEPGGRVVIGRVICGGAAHSSGLLHEGDELVEVNGVPLLGRSVDEVIELLTQLDDDLTFTLIAGAANRSAATAEAPLFVKTLFRYDAHTDSQLPCRELGLSFEAREVLQIIDQADPNWWQAKRPAEAQCQLAGLVPSSGLLRDRVGEPAATQQDDDDSSVDWTGGARRTLVAKLLFACPRTPAPPTRPKRRPAGQALEPPELAHYEPLGRFEPTAGFKRPIILVGPKLVGRRELWTRLLADKRRFSSAVAHTSRARQPSELDGVDFHFVSRAEFERDMNEAKFVEFGLYHNQYYGTSVESIRRVISRRKTCVQLIGTASMLNFRQGPAGAQLKPYFVFVKPESCEPEKLRNLVGQLASTRSHLDERVRAIAAEVELVERHYLPYFDLVLAVSDIERAYEQLLGEIDKIESAGSWIPAFWCDPS